MGIFSSAIAAISSRAAPCAAPPFVAGLLKLALVNGAKSKKVVFKQKFDRAVHPFHSLPAYDLLLLRLKRVEPQNRALCAFEPQNGAVSSRRR
jgi:hypothetical protein